MLIEYEDDIFLDCYLHLLDDNDFDIEFIWGGRDSGKSQHTAMQLMFESIENPNFRCILIKKTFESIKDSQWQTLKDLTDEYELYDLFTFNKSPLEIHGKNGSQFIARGCDDPRKLKSIRNPSHAWIEEGDQLTNDDLTLILTTLRSNDSKVKIYFVFNPELPKRISDKDDFWLYRDWFKGHNNKNFSAAKTFDSDGKKVQIKYRSTWTTYRDNPYVTEVRKAFLEGLKVTNPAYYMPYCLGEWGAAINENPFFYGYNRNKHDRDSAPETGPQDLWLLSFDFNQDPCTLVVFVRPRPYGPIAVFDLITANQHTEQGASPLEAVCRIFTRKYITSGKCLPYFITVTGDASGRAGSADRVAKRDFYDTIARELKISMGQVRVPKANPPHTFSRELINHVLINLKDGLLFFTPECSKLCAEIQTAYPDSDGTLNKAKKEQGLHALDAWRYGLHLLFEFQKYKDLVTVFNAKNKHAAPR